MGFEKSQACNPERAVHSTIKDNKKNNSLVGTLISVVACCTKERMKMDVV